MSDKWYKNTGSDIDVVLSSKAIITRNLKGYKFPAKMTLDEKDEVVSKVCDALSDRNMKLYRLDGIEESERDELIDGQILGGRTLYEDTECKAILANDDMSTSVILNDGDHIKVKAQASGYTNSVYKMCEDIAVDLENKLDIAFSNKYGYLGSTVNNTGMGLRLFFTIAVPGICRTGDGLKVLSQKVKSLEWSMYPFLDSGKAVKGDIYIISSTAALGVDEATVLMAADRLIREIIKIEHLLRDSLRNKRLDILENSFYRSYGILYYSKSVDPFETLDQLGWIRLYNGFQNKSEIDISWEDINTITSQVLWSIYPHVICKDNQIDGRYLALKIGEVLKRDKGGN